MTDQTIHDLAVAYAHAKLLQRQQLYPEDNGLNEELAAFIKCYNYAKYQIPIEHENLDESF